MVAALDIPAPLTCIRKGPDLSIAASETALGAAQEGIAAPGRQEVAQLISAIYEEFRHCCSSVLDQHNIPGFHDFGELAVAFGLPEVTAWK